MPVLECCLRMPRCHMPRSPHAQVAQYYEDTVPPWTDPTPGQPHAIADVKTSRYAFRCDVGSNLFDHKPAAVFAAAPSPFRLHGRPCTWSCRSWGMRSATCRSRPSTGATRSALSPAAQHIAWSGAQCIALSCLVWCLGRRPS